MKLSKNFTLSELAFSSTAVKLGIQNEPNKEQIENLRDLVINILQPIRDYFNLPVSISSGFRSANLNRTVGGSVTSQHLYGQAADIRVIGIGNDILWQYICDNLDFDQVILEHVPAKNPHKGWVHVSFSNRHRHEAFSIPESGVELPGLVYADS